MLYLNRYNDLNKIVSIDESPIENRLKDENITYTAPQEDIKSATYIKGKVMKFSDKDLVLPNQQIDIRNGTDVTSMLIKPVKLRNIDDDKSFTDFVQTNVKGGGAYSLWKLNREERVAIFFQTKNNRPIYNMNGVIKVFWNASDEVWMYEQTMLDDVKEMKQQKNVIQPLQVIQRLYSKNLLKKGSHITQMNLGYSTRVEVIETQVFVPTWEVHVKTSDGKIEEFFVDAVGGEVIDIQVDKDEDEEEGWGV